MIDFVRNSNSVVVISDDDKLVAGLRNQLPPGKRLSSGGAAPSDIRFVQYSPADVSTQDLGRFGLCLVDLSSNGAVEAISQLPKSSGLLGTLDEPYYMALTTDEFTTGTKTEQFPREKFHDTVRKDNTGNYLDYLSDRVGVLLSRTALGIPVLPR